MNLGNQILNIRKEQQLTQEEFGRLFHVTRQTVSNWENEKSYPDLQVLVDMSNRFEISLDILLKEDSRMVRAIDKERILGTVKHEKSIIDFFYGCRYRTDYILLVFPKFHNKNSSNFCWTFNDRYWVV